jgi:hypothetical protein
MCGGVALGVAVGGWLHGGGGGVCRGGGVVVVVVVVVVGLRDRRDS